MPDPMSSLDQRSQAYLAKSTHLYELLVAHALRLEKRRNPEKTLRWISLAAKVAWAAHPGRLSDERLEAIAVRIGRALQPAATVVDNVGRARDDNETSRRVLHVATTVAATGGHSRIVENWVKADSGSVHSLLLIEQGREPVRPALVRQIEASGGNVAILAADATLLKRARLLRQAAQQGGYACIVLHHHPDDVVPLVAFATEDCPPVAVMNHADHVFWLGVSIADIVVEFREFGAELSREQRAARRCVVFPLPLDIQSAAPTRAEARARLGIPEDVRMMLTIGTASKYVPTERHRFFETLGKALDCDPTARLYVIGVGEGDAGFLNIPRHERIELLGIISDPIDYEAAADLYLEGFPFGSYTAMLETAARGVRPIMMHSPTAHNDSAREISLNGLTRPAKDETSYVSELLAILGDDQGRNQIAQAVAKRVRSHHGDKASKCYIEKVYRQLLPVRHQITVLPQRPSQSGRHDLDLAGFQSAQPANPVADRILDETLHGLSYDGIWNLFRISLGAGDTRLTRRHAKSWVSILKRKILHSVS